MSTATTTIRQTFAELKQTLGAAKRPLHYLAIPPSLFGVVVSALAASGLNENARLVVEKPFGHDRASAQALNRTLLAAFSGSGDLSHRPLSRQGTGSEHPLYPVRERDVRAAVEPQLCPQHPDHHGGSVWGRGSGQLLRRDRGAARRGPEPHAAGARQPDDGAADRRRPRGGARPEGRAPEGCQAPGRSEHRARPVSRLSPGQGGQAGFDGRDLCRGEIIRGLLAMGGRSDLYPRRQMPALDGGRGDGRISSRRRAPRSATRPTRRAAICACG